MHITCITEYMFYRYPFRNTAFTSLFNIEKYKNNVALLRYYEWK